MASASLLPPGLPRALGLLLRPLEPYLAPIWSAIVAIVRHARTQTVRLLKGRGPVEDICSQGWHSAHMTKRLSRLLRLSGGHYPGLPAPSTVFTPQALDVPSLTTHIAKGEGMPLEDEADNFLARVSLEQCLSCISHANLAIAEARQLKDTAFDHNNKQHESLLEELWSLLKPDVKRVGGRKTKEWGEIGFQGDDPATDFRGMGLLGLHHLVAFAKGKPAKARAALLDSHHPRRFYPFAATGINISRYVLFLLEEERLLDPEMYESFEKGFEHQQHAEGSPERTQALIQRGLEVAADHYGRIFLEFDRRWQEADPINIMAFPKIFAALQDDYTRQLVHARGDASLTTAFWQGY